MIIERWWPTPIYYSFLEQPVLDQVQADFERVYRHYRDNNLFKQKPGWNPSSVALSDTTFLTSLIDQFELETFKIELLDHVQKFIQQYNIHTTDIKIKQSWMTLTSQGQSNHTHSHGPADISGVYYFQTNGQDGSIYFESNNKLLSASALFNSGSHPIVYKPEVGKLILFPGFVEHGVYENTTDNDRVSVSFNIFVNRF